MDNPLVFSIQSMKIKDGKTLKGLKPDSDGIYHGIPVGVIGLTSRNNAYYIPQTFANCMNNSDTIFFKSLREGGLCGEYGHPFLKNPKEELHRIPYIDPNNVSHGILGISTKETENGEYIIIYSDIVPRGPKGPQLDTDLRSSVYNMSFSLRSLCYRPEVVNGVFHKPMQSLVTFDAVPVGGFEQASKRYALEAFGASYECWSYDDIPVSVENILETASIRDLIGMESKDADELFDILDSDTIQISNMTSRVCVTADKALFNGKSKMSLYHTLQKLNPSTEKKG